ncbi:hypothetical protein [Lysinibacillus sphaericus]|uniref:Uncharacterized protein n=1 Tax=Lysinibacillus sphaericus OT4b.31 TaxID=1285586 RepID=R7ZJ74_LYSSH|nr:hypothetical protein [Lysinibacillus sphaericus]EON74123.1 hypothetical protein H131_01538 [Lysinibacillus sphaericus OT4b.31]
MQETAAIMPIVTFKMKKGEVLVVTDLKEPGAGAIELARQYIGPKAEYYDALDIMADVIDGYFIGVEDPRVRRCNCCGFFYRDTTKNNSSLTCSLECKTKKDVVIKAWRREVRKAGKPRRPTFKNLYYTEGLEYPFWANEDRMYEYDRKRGGYSYGDNFEEYVGRKLLDAQMGGKKKSAQIIDYDGYDKAMPFEVNLSEKLHKTNKKTVYKRSAAEIDAELLERYGAEKLRQARMQAKYFETGNYF